MVDLYTYTTAKAAKNKIVGFNYVLACDHISKDLITLTDGGTLENVGKNEAEVLCAIKALKRVKEGYHITIHTQSPYLAAVINEWLAGWMKRGTNSKGEPLAPIYTELADLLVKRPTQAIVNEQHEFLKWQKREAENMITSNDKRSP